MILWLNHRGLHGPSKTNWMHYLNARDGHAAPTQKPTWPRQTKGKALRERHSQSASGRSHVRDDPPGAPRCRCLGKPKYRRTGRPTVYPRSGSSNTHGPSKLHLRVRRHLAPSLDLSSSRKQFKRRAPRPVGQSPRLRWRAQCRGQRHSPARRLAGGSVRSLAPIARSPGRSHSSGAKASARPCKPQGAALLGRHPSSAQRRLHLLRHPDGAA